MKNDYTTNSHYLTYTFLFRKVGRIHEKYHKPCRPFAVWRHSTADQALWLLYISKKMFERWKGNPTRNTTPIYSSISWFSLLRQLDTNTTWAESVDAVSDIAVEASFVGPTSAALHSWLYRNYPRLARDHFRILHYLLTFRWQSVYGATAQ